MLDTMPSRKRTRDDVVMEEHVATQQENPVLDRIRNMSEFAALMQYLFLFGKAMKVEVMDVEVCSRCILTVLVVRCNAN